VARADGGLDDGDLTGSCEEQAQEAREIGLRLHRHHPASDGGEGAGAVPGVCADVEDQVAGRGEGRVEAPESPLPSGNAVVDRNRPRQAEQTVDVCHAGSQAARST
jgi:hypothetical protein